MQARDATIEGTFSPAQEGIRLDKALSEAIPDLSRERIKTLLAEGAVLLNGRTVGSASVKVPPNSSFCVTMPPPVDAEARPQDIPLLVVFEDDDLIVIDKPAGMVVHPAAGHADGTLVNALLHHCRGQLSGIGGVSRPGIVHRIDKDTSGLLVAAKTDTAHQGLSRLFASHNIERRYLAITKGIPRPRQGTIEGNIGRNPRDRKKMAVVEAGTGKTAITHYAVKEILRNAALVECKLETGRTHQVRVHMARIGHPLIGDPLYSRGAKKSISAAKDFRFSRQALHAATLGFEHPVSGEKLAFSSPLPEDMQQLFRRLCV